MIITQEFLQGFLTSYFENPIKMLVGAHSEMQSVVQNIVSVLVKVFVKIFDFFGSAGGVIIWCFILDHQTDHLLSKH